MKTLRVLVLSAIASMPLLAQLNVTGTVDASQTVSGTFNIARIPTGATGSTVPFGNDARFLNATSISGTSISAMTGIMKLTSGTPSNAAAADVIALWSGTCNSSSVMYGDGACRVPGGTMVYPAGSGLPIVVSGTSWGTTVAAPTGTIVGTTDTQTLTNKTLDGVTSATMAFLDPTSSVQTQLNAKGVGTVTSVTNPVVPSWLTSSIATATTTPAITLAPTTAQTVHQVIGTCGAGTTFAPCLLTSGDLPVALSSQTSVNGTTIPSSATLMTTVTGVTASQLPNPSASTLGGVQSLAAVGSKWVNTISTSGVPSATQPAFSDISGSATAGQLPTATEVWTKYTVGFATVNAAATTQAITLVALTARQLVCGLVEKVGTAFAGTSITGLTGTIGDSNGSAITYSQSPYNMLATVSNTNFIANNVIGMASFLGGNIQANFTSVGANLSALTAGSVEYDICITTLP